MSIDISIKKLQNNYAKNLERIKEEEEDSEDFIKIALIEAERIWLNIQALKLTNIVAFNNMSDSDKVNLIQKDFKEFYDNFPVVSRYMICLEQYKRKAFKRMLVRCASKKNDNDKKTEEGKKSDNEKQWVERQADYVRFLWEEYQGPYFSKKDSDDIWKQAFTALSEEFKQFREMHKNMEDKIKKDKIKYKTELLKEMSERIIKGEQSLDDTNTKELLVKLQDRLFKQRFKKLMEQIKKDCKVTPHVSQGFGKSIPALENHIAELKQSNYKKNYKKMDINKILKF